MKRKLIAISLLAIMVLTIACTALAATHTHKYTWKVKIAATCHSDGLKEYKCDCGDVKDRKPIPKSHSWSMVNGFPKTTTTNEYFWVPSCGGHPWNHSHYRPKTVTEYRYHCSKCGEYNSEYSTPQYGHEHCQYN